MDNKENPVRMQVVYLLYIIATILYLFLIFKFLPFICSKLRNKDRENKEVREIIRKINVVGTNVISP